MLTRTPKFHVPALEGHLNHFGLERADFYYAGELSRLANLRETIAECESSEEKAELRLRFPLGIIARSILRLEFMGAGMGGVGAADIGFLFDPKAGIQLLCWFDLENDNAGYVSSFQSARKPWLGRNLAELAIRDLGPCAVDNEAVTQIENRLSQKVSKAWLRDAWARVASEASRNPEESLALFDRVYSETKRLHRFWGV